MSSSTNNRSPQQGRRGSRGHRDNEKGGGGRGRRARSRSPRGFSGRDWNLDGISNDTQRHEEHYKKARIFVGNIDLKTVTRGDLSAVFSKHGDVVAVSIHPGYSFVQMDSERSANRAVNYEHGAILNGCKINVEFSTAALKAGARFKKLPPLHQSSPHHGDHLGPPPPRGEYPPSSYPPHHYPETDAYDDRERRLQRILALERELKQERSAMYPLGGDNYYGTTGGGGASRVPPPPTNSNPFTSADHFSRRTPPPSRKDYFSRRDSGGVIGGATRRERSLSPRPRPQTDAFASRLPNDRYGSFGSRFAGGGAFNDYGRGNGPSQAWQ